MNDKARPVGVQIEHTKTHDLTGLLDYAPAAVVSRTMYQSKIATITLFSFDQGQELSEHSAPFDAIVQVIEGRVELTIGGKVVPATSGQMVVMPAHVPHAVQAVEKFKMLLTMIREQPEVK